MHPQLKFTGRGWPRGGLMPAETFHISFICLGHFLILFFFFLNFCQPNTLNSHMDKQARVRARTHAHAIHG